MQEVSTELDVLEDLDIELDLPWEVVVWDDPVNLMGYVTMVFRRVFGWSTEQCERKMLEVHTKGSAVVLVGDKQKAEMTAVALRSYQLWASVRRAF